MHRKVHSAPHPEALLSIPTHLLRVPGLFSLLCVFTTLQGLCLLLKGNETWFQNPVLCTARLYSYSLFKPCIPSPLKSFLLQLVNASLLNPKILKPKNLMHCINLFCIFIHILKILKKIVKMMTYSYIFKGIIFSI